MWRPFSALSTSTNIQPMRNVCDPGKARTRCNCANGGRAYSPSISLLISEDRLAEAGKHRSIFPNLMDVEKQAVAAFCKAQGHDPFQTRLVESTDVLPLCRRWARSRSQPQRNIRKLVISSPIRRRCSETKDKIRRKWMRIRSHCLEPTRSF